MPQGSTLLKVENISLPEVKAIASYLDGDYSVFLLNTSTKEHKISVSLPKKQKFQVYSYTRKDSTSQQPLIGQTVFEGDGYSATVAPRSLTVLSSMKNR
jgi:hypothetical protein